MSESMHSPGPWLRIDDRIVVAPQCMGGVYELATVSKHDCTPETFEANMKLMLAPPDMLAALELVISDTSEPEDYGDYVVVQMSSGVLDEVRAAIKKAKGG